MFGGCTDQSFEQEQLRAESDLEVPRSSLLAFRLTCLCVPVVDRSAGWREPAGARAAGRCFSTPQPYFRGDGPDYTAPFCVLSAHSAVAFAPYLRHVTYLTCDISDIVNLSQGSRIAIEVDTITVQVIGL